MLDNATARTAAWRRAACAALAVLCCMAAHAGPAAWYYWRSKVDGQRVCAQVSPGPGWERDSEPYEGPGCTAPRKVFVIPMR